MKSFRSQEGSSPRTNSFSKGLERVKYANKMLKSLAPESSHSYLDAAAGFWFCTGHNQTILPKMILESTVCEVFGIMNASSRPFGR